MAANSQLMSLNESKKKIKKEKAVTKPKKITTQQIPEKKLKEALQVLKDDEQLNLIFKQSVNCMPPIHLGAEMETRFNPSTRLIKQMQTCLLQRDWRSLAECLLAADPRSDCARGQYMGVISKYVTILTAYNDPELLEMYAQSVLREEDVEQILRKNTKYPAALNN